MKSDHNIKHVWRFISEDIWDIELSSLSWLRRFGINIIRVIHLVFTGFRENECPLHASALTYISLVSIVPILALGLSVLRGLGAGEVAEQKILQAISIMPQQFQNFVIDILTYVRNTNFTTLGGVGLVLLFVLVIQGLGRVEMSFNRVWGVSAPRPLLRKVTDYISILMVVPVLVIAATTINATLTSPAIANFIQARMGFAQFLYPKLLSLTPLLVTWIAFAFLYKYVPNTKVRVLPAVTSGVLGGSFWIFWQWIYIRLQIGVSGYNAIYATLASVFIFLFWLYISWQIVLLGAEIGFALQNHSTYKMERRAHDASPQSKIMLALSVIANAGQSMISNAPQFEISSFARNHQVPVRLINEVVDKLVKAKLLTEVADGDNRFVLAKVPDVIMIKDVINAIVQSGSSPQSLGLDHLDPGIQHILARADSGTAEALQNASVKDIIHK